MEAVRALIQKLIEARETEISLLKDFLRTLQSTPSEIIEQTENRTNEYGRWSWNPDNIRWVTVEGSRGPYERYPAKGQKPEMTIDYKNLLKDLKAHNGRLNRNGYFYWLFSPDSDIVGRKKQV